MKTKNTKKLFSPLECAQPQHHGHLFDDLKICGSSGEDPGNGFFFIYLFILIFIKQDITATFITYSNITVNYTIYNNNWEF